MDTTLDGSVYYNISLKGRLLFLSSPLDVNPQSKIYNRLLSYNSSEPFFFKSGLSQPWQAYALDVTQVCKNDTTSEDTISLQTTKSSQKPHLGLMRLVTPWIQDSTNSFIGKNKSNR